MHTRHLPGKLIIDRGIYRIELAGDKIKVFLPCNEKLMLTTSQSASALTKILKQIDDQRPLLSVAI